MNTHQIEARIDDLEDAQKRLTSIVEAHLHMHGTLQEALKLMKGRVDQCDKLLELTRDITEQTRDQVLGDLKDMRMNMTAVSTQVTEMLESLTVSRGTVQ
jgi:hypothetical protein